MKKKIIKNYSAIIFIISNLFSESLDHAVIIGKIIDSQTSLPIYNVNIGIVETAIGTNSNKDGTFKITANKKENRAIYFSHVGYEKKIIQLKSNVKDELIVELVKNTIIYTPIVVTGLNIERPLSDSPIITEVISRKEIDRFSSTDVIGLLEKSIPNIQVINDSHGTNLKIQGLDSKYFLFLVNGNRMTGETTGNIDFSRLNVADIDRIEILNGGASTNYGSGAIGGVINIVTNKNSSSFNLSMQAKEYSENNDKSQWISLGLGHNEHFLSSHTNIARKSSDGYRINGNIIQNVFSDISLTQEFSIKPLENLRFDISGTYYSHDTEDYNYLNKRRDKYYDKQFIINGEYVDINNDLYRISWNYDKYDKYTLFENYNEERIRSSHRLNFINLNYSKSKDTSNRYFLGIENYTEVFYSPSNLDWNNGGNPFAGYLGADTLKSVSINSIYLNNEYLINSETQIIGGLRYDMNTIFGDHLGPHFSILFKADNYRLRFNASRNFKSPTLKELYMQWDHLGMFDIKGNENLKPEISNYYGASFEKLDSKYSLTLKAYIHNLKNMISSVSELADNNQMVYKNFQSVLMQGVDIYFKLDNKNNSFRTTLSLLNPRDQVIKKQLDGTNKVSLSSTFVFYINNLKQSFNINFKYVGKTVYSYGDIPEYKVLNFSYNYKILDRFKVSLGIDNLINTSNLDNRTTVFPDKRYFITLNYNS